VDASFAKTTDWDVAFGGLYNSFLSGNNGQKGFGEIAEVWCSTSSAGTYFRFLVVSQTATTLTVQVPADAVVGAYTYARIISPGTGTNSISLTATGKKFTVIP
jgi:hypothetical protein